MLKYPRILYFIEGSMPTQADIKAVALLGGNTVFRNAHHCGEGHNPEVCDGVSGAVPAVYKAKYKDGSEVIAAFTASVTGAPVETPPAPVVPPAPPAPVVPEIPPAPPAPVEGTEGAGVPEIPSLSAANDGWGQQPAE